jgi:hypothetical protein
MKFILINGPKRSGKTTLAKLFAPNDVAVIGFSYHLKRFCHGIYLGAAGWLLDPDVFDNCKEEPQEILGGMSWRQVYIYYSEKVIKLLHGKEWFGEQLRRAANDSGNPIVAVPDSGFVEEAENLVRHVGAENVVLIRLHRPGHGFEGDSRSYIDLAHVGVPSRDIYLPEGLNWLDLLQENMRDVMIYLGAVERDG